jgi:uncharacterized protein YceK
MSKRKIYNCLIIVSVFFAVALILLGCNSNASKTAATPESSKGSAQLWSENCGRCHNLRTSTSYSDAEWQVAMHHMRVRGYLTGEEHRRILEYLQASN